MSLNIRITGCCGLYEIDNLSQVATPEEAMKALTKLFDSYKTGTVTVPVAFCLFSGVVKRVRGDHASSRPDDYGQAFHDFITINKLGAVTPSTVGVNPNTKNQLRVWVWQLDKDAIQKWYTANCPLTPPPPPTPTKPSKPAGQLANQAGRISETSGGTEYGTYTTNIYTSGMANTSPHTTSK